MTRAAIYCRISQDREGAGLGVDRQEKDCRALAKTLGWDVTQVFADNDISAYSGKRRPGYVALLEAIERGELDGLIVWHTDRLHRSVRELLDFLDLIKGREDFGIQTARAGQVDLSTPTGRALAITYGAWAQQESEHKADRIRRQKKQTAEQGKNSGGGTRPYGFEPDRVTVREPEAANIRDAARRILDHSDTVRSLCREWNENGVPTVTGARWTPQVMRTMLMSARISGRREHRGSVVADAVWNGIINPDDSNALREMLADPSRTTYDGDKARKYLLTGFAHCGRCDAKIKARPYPNRERSYVCARTEGGLHLHDELGRPRFKPDGSPLMCGQGNLRIHADSLELYVAEAAFDYLDEFVQLASTLRDDDPDARQEAELWRSMANYQKRLEVLERRFYVDGAMPQRTFDRLANELQVEMEKTKREIGKVRRSSTIAQLPTSSAVARAMWPDRDFHWRRTLLTTLVERVTVGEGVRGRNKFDPNRVTIRWHKPA